MQASANSYNCMGVWAVLSDIHIGIHSYRGVRASAVQLVVPVLDSEICVICKTCRVARTKGWDCIVTIATAYTILKSIFLGVAPACTRHPITFAFTVCNSPFTTGTQ